MKKIQLSLFPFAGSIVTMLLIFIALNSFGQTTQPTDAQKAERERAKNEQQASAKGGSDDVKLTRSACGKWMKCTVNSKKSQGQPMIRK
jgi:hypothetical protein